MLDPTSKAIASLFQILKSDPKLQTIIAAPTLSDSDKSQIVAELEKHTGGVDKTGTVKNFLSALAENNRLGLLEGVCEKFGTLMSAAKGEVELTVTSASVSPFLPSRSNNFLVPPKGFLEGGSVSTMLTHRNRNSTINYSSVSKQPSPSPNTAKARSSRP